MGVRYSASESSSLIEAMTSNVEIANQITDRLASGADHLVSSLDSGELQGAAYTAGRGLFSDIIIPAIKKLQEAIDDIQTELNSYQAADQFVSKYGNLDLEELKELKRLREEMLETIVEQIAEHDSFLNLVKDTITFNLEDHFETMAILSSAKQNLEVGLDSVNEKIAALEVFVNQVSSYFSDSLNVLKLAIQGATQLGQIVVDANGNYSTDGLDMTWFVNMKNQVITSQNVRFTDLPVEDALYAQHLMTQYGFDEQTARGILKVRDGIDEKFSNLSQTEKDYLLLLSLGSFIYGEQMDAANGIVGKIKGGIQDVMWANTSGTVSDIIGLPIPNSSIFLLHIGLSDTDVSKLRYNIRLQNEMSSGGFGNYSTLDNIQISEYKKKAEAIYGSMSRKQFEDFWDEKYLSYSNSADFAHQSITMATILNTNIVRAPNLYTLSNEETNNLSGWRGDVTKDAFAEPSMGNDDYRADLDAVNITELMKTGKTYQEATNQYYNNLYSGKYTRADKFLEYKDLKTIKRVIYDSLVPKDYIESPSGNNGYFINKTESEQKKYVDQHYKVSSDFIKALENRQNNLYESEDIQP